MKTYIVKTKKGYMAVYQDYFINRLDRQTKLNNLSEKGLFKNNGGLYDCLNGVCLGIKRIYSDPNQIDAVILASISDKDGFFMRDTFEARKQKVYEQLYITQN